MSQGHPAFEKIRSQRIESLNVDVEEYQHKVTGAQHYHLSADNDENVFLVGLRTIPTDSRGVAHILEHTALCGSERFPVRDPFFMMIRRSLNTFMNAFTGTDYTAYPFASKNKKDFNNLLDVYLDAVFFSRLDELDFAQEGHRVEFAIADDPKSDLVYKGVVFNEMKGAMSSPVSLLWQTISKYVFPNTTYHFNSGGDPEHIPDLTYEQLKAFYQTHYHPSNAVFMTYGDIPAADHQAMFEDKVLSKFTKLDAHISVEDEKRYYSPIAVTESYALEEPGDTSGKTHILLSWLLGKSTDLEQQLKAQLLSSVLLDNSASPLRQALETSELGSAPSPVCGLEDSNREMSFMCGIEGSDPQHAQAIEDLVLKVLTDVAENGIEQSQVEAVLHQLELSQREIRGEHYPYGLQLILGGMSAAMHRGDAIAQLNLDPVLKKLHQDIQDPDFIKQLARELLLDNPHRVRLTLQPDQQLAGRRDTAEAARLSEIKAGLSDTDKQEIVSLAKALADRQQQEDDESILPKVGLEDIPDEMHIAEGDETQVGHLPTAFYPQGTNGLVYQQIVIDLPALDPELVEILPLFTQCFTELGCGDKDYLETQAWQASVAGSVNAYSKIRGKVDDNQAVTAFFVLSGKALAYNQQALIELLQETLLHPRFDEAERIKELVGQICAYQEQSVTGNGHSLAMMAASAGISPGAAMAEQLHGLTGLQCVKQLDKTLQDPQQSQAAVKTLADKFQRLHQLLLSAPRRLLAVGEAEHRESLLGDLRTRWQDSEVAADSTDSFVPQLENHSVKQVWLANTQVNFCAKAYPTVAMAHPDAPVLSVLAGYLRNGYLHRVIREQGGAYGGGASQDSSNGAFRFFSYRDPRFSETLADFDAAVDWVKNEAPQWSQVEEAILGVIGAIDKPSSPAGEATQAYHSNLQGYSKAHRQQFRSRVLKVTGDDLQRVAATYLVPEKANVAVISNASLLEQQENLGLDVIQL